MGDDNMDPCECIWSHELYMRRLLNIIRNSQSTCTDSECFEDGFRSQSPPDQNVLLLSLFVVAALFFYYFRPRPQRLFVDKTKSGNDNNNDGNPPTTIS